MKRGIDPKSWEKLFNSAKNKPSFPAGLAAGAPVSERNKMHNNLNANDPAIVVNDLVELVDGKECLVCELREGNWAIVQFSDKTYATISRTRFSKHVKCMTEEELEVWKA